MKNYIGIDQTKAAELVKELNILLASYEVYYQNLRGFHWNITGKEFFELNIKKKHSTWYKNTVPTLIMAVISKCSVAIGFWPGPVHREATAKRWMCTCT